MRYDGTKEKYSVLMKLMGKAFKTFRLMDILKVPTEWESTKPANPVKDQIVDLFQSNAVTTNQVKAQADLIWSHSDLVNIDHFFKIFATPPADDAALNNARNVTKFKHAMAGANIWNSLTSDFQIELLGEEDEFARDKEYDGMQLWHHIRTSVNPSTKVGDCALKEQIELANLEKFGYDIKPYNIWLSDTRKEIIRQEGTGRYNEYIRYMFKTYLSSKNSEFNETIKAIKRNWTQDLLDKDYSHTDLMSTVTKTYNNIVADGGWELADKMTESSQKGGTYMQTKFLALTAQVEAFTKGNGGGAKMKVLKKSAGGILTQITKPT